MEHVSLTTVELDRALDRIAQLTEADAAIRSRYAHLLRKAAPALVAALREDVNRPNAFPPIADVVAAQCSIFDNWRASGGQKPSRKKRESGARAHRFKATIEVWTQAGRIDLERTVPTFKANVALMTGTELHTKVLELRSSKKTLRPFRQVNPQDIEGVRFEAYGEALMGYAGAAAGYRLGPLFTVKSGTHFHLNTFALAREDLLLAHDPALMLIVRTEEGDFEFNSFDRLTSQRKGLAGNCVLQSRMSKLVGRWRTAKIE